MNGFVLLSSVFSSFLSSSSRSDLLPYTILVISLPLVHCLAHVGCMWDVWQRQIAQSQLKGDCLAPCSLKLRIIGIHHKQYGLQIDKSYGIHNNRQTIQQRRRGDYIWRGKKDRNEKKVHDNMKMWWCWGEPCGGGMERRIQRSTEELHLWPQTNVFGGLGENVHRTFIIIGS